MLKKFRDLFSSLFPKRNSSSEDKELMEDITSLKDTLENLQATLMDSKKTDLLVSDEESAKEITAILNIISTLEELRRAHREIKKITRSSFLERISAMMILGINFEKRIDADASENLKTLARIIFRRADALIRKVSPLIKLPIATYAQAEVKEFQIKLIKLLTEIGVVIVRNYNEDDLKQALGTTKA